MSLRVVFMGTPDFAVTSLQGLLMNGLAVEAVFTQPDRPRGRGHRLVASPVKRAAEASGIAVYQPRTLRDDNTLTLLRQLEPDVIVVVAFGQLLPKTVLEIPARGCINVHASLLPRHRGAAPIQAALAAGDTITGVTTMYMDEGLDTGDIILQREVPVAEDDDAGALHDRLAVAGASLLVETLRQVSAGAVLRRRQNDLQATYAPRFTKEDARIDWSREAEQIRNHIRAFSPRPGAYTKHRGRTLKVLAAKVLQDVPPEARVDVVEGNLERGGDLGVIGDVGPEGFVVRCGLGRLLVARVQPAGRGPMSGRDYSNGYRLQAGERLGDVDGAAGQKRETKEVVQP